jgi:light-regulated signal transduction histidine kinase (bacteriophytochrome)/CheY-like chemotaxis protein
MLDLGQQPSVSLANCDVEPIHIPGSIQPFGALMAFDVNLVRVLRHSKNADSLLGLTGDINGTLAEGHFGSELIHSLRNALSAMGKSARPALLFDQALPSGTRFDVSVHSYRSTVIVEFEPATDSGNEPLQMSRMLVDRIKHIATTDQLIRTTARLLRGVLAYDRVMIYRFERDDAGKVIAEAKRADLESFLGQYFPGSDIPQQARALYLKNTIRVVSSSEYQAVPLVPQFDLSGEPLDLTYAHLRSVSPIHLEYLRNMGVAASMSISIIADGELWGLIACHHYSHRTLPMAMRVATELFGEFFSLHLSALQHNRKLSAATEARAYLDRVLQLASQRDIDEVLVENLVGFGSLIPSDGLALYLDGKWSTLGSTPAATQAPALALFVGSVANGRVWASHSLINHFPEASAYNQTAVGILAIPLSRRPRDYLIYFRKEWVQTLDWGGNPEKSYESGPLGDRLTPRKSFAIWKEIVRDQSQPWAESDREIAEAARVSLVEVMLRHSELLEEERAKAELRHRMLNDELNHRVKNILALIKSLVGRSMKEGRTLEDYVTSLKGRIQALSLAHDQVVRGEGGGLLNDLLSAELSPYRSAENVIEVNGDTVWIDSRAYSVMALVLHELATNAAKYGALSIIGGRLTVSATFNAVGDCELEWTERGGPEVLPPSRQGFGTALLDRSVPFDLDGESDVQFSREGLTARFKLPARHVRRRKAKTEAVISDQPLLNAPSDLSPELRIMLLEDQMLIAMEVEGMLSERGFRRVITVNSAAEALKLIERGPPAIAILDINLGAGTSMPVAEALADCNIPFIFATGYGEGAIVSARFANASVIRKPYDADELLDALARSLRR